MKKDLSALDAKFEAQKIAFAPLYFQAVVSMRELGILDFIIKTRNGATLSQIMEATGVSEYGVELLLEAAEVLELIEVTADSRYKITKTGYFVAKDQMTGININYSNDVCYDGARFMTQSIQESRPVGLKTLGDWPTIYEGLSILPEKARKSWFDFDHYYSDGAFPSALEIVFAEKPKRIFDIGGNTGKWAIACCNHDPDVQISILDLPVQLNVAKKNIAENGFTERVELYPINLLDTSRLIPEGADAIWMSQFLDCFSKEQILAILKNARQAAGPDTFIYILEPFFDNQAYPAAKYSLVATSLYFTIMANGNSKMYSVEVMKDLAKEAGLEVVEVFSLIGDSYHSVLKCRKVPAN